MLLDSFNLMGYQITHWQPVYISILDVYVLCWVWWIWMDIENCYNNKHTMTTKDINSRSILLAFICTDVCCVSEKSLKYVCFGYDKFVPKFCSCSVHALFIG